MPYTSCVGLRRRWSLVAIAAGALAAVAPAQPVAIAQPSPTLVLAAPADGISYYRRTKEAQRLIDQKKWSEAETLLRHLVAEFPLDSAWAGRLSNWGRLATAFREQGKHRDAIAAYHRLIDLQGPGPAYPGGSARYWIAASHAALGEKKQALAAIETMVFEDQFLARPALMEDTAFARLREEPRFRELAGKLAASAADRVSGWRADIDYLAAELRRNNPIGEPIPVEFERRRSALEAAVPRLSDHEIIAGMGQMIAPLNRGHTSLWLGDPDAPTKLSFRPLPFRTYVFPEGLFVIEGYAGSKALAGAQVLEIGGVDVEEALRRVAASDSLESPSEALWQAPDALMRPAVLKGLGLAESADRAELKLKLRDGSVVTRTFGTIDEPDHGRLRGKLLPPPRVQPRLFLSKIHDEVHWLRPLPEHSAIYIQVANMMPDEDETLPEFGLRLRRAIDEHKPRNLVIDLRHNNGGNSFSYVELLRTLTAFSTLPNRRVYALIGRNVYSAAANFTTDLERLVQPVFVGESTSQMGNQWGDESMFVLPYSGITGAFAGVRWQLSHPWDKRRSITPHVPVPLTAAAYFRGIDPALNAVFRLMSEDK